MIRPNLCHYKGAYIFVNGTIAVLGERADDAAKLARERNKVVIFKNCAPFTDCISQLNNFQIDYAKDLDVVIPM